MSEQKYKNLTAAKEIIVNIVHFPNFALLENASLPSYETVGSAGMDLRAALAKDEILRPMEIKLVPTGLGIELAVGFEAQVRPRSGLASKYGITLINAPGTIDSDYRGEIFVPIINLGRENFTILPGMRIAQMVVAPYVRVQWNQVNKLGESERGQGGFGSTGQ